MYFWINFDCLSAFKAWRKFQRVGHTFNSKENVDSITIWKHFLGYAFQVSSDQQLQIADYISSSTWSKLPSKTLSQIKHYTRGIGDDRHPKTISNTNLRNLLRRLRNHVCRCTRIYQELRLCTRRMMGDNYPSQNHK